jgi:serine/threonine-protein kinase
MPLQTGKVLVNRYRIVSLLGQGGFGAVYRAWDLNIKIACAIKENTDTSPESRRQFEREAKMLRTLNFPSLPGVTDYFETSDGRQYLVMDFIEGEDLQQILAKHGAPLPEDQALAWIEQICDALNYLHSQDEPIIHRDIKPANIKITPAGAAVLVDFGIAKVDPGSVTTKGAQAVTPGFSPYEQYGRGHTDERSDIYSLGATMYAMLTGQEPVESIERVAKDQLTRPRQVSPNISTDTERIVLRAMQVMPEKRYASMGQLSENLQRVRAARLVLVAVSSSARASASPVSPTIVRPPSWWMVALQASALLLGGLFLLLAPMNDVYDVFPFINAMLFFSCGVSLSAIFFSKKMMPLRLSMLIPAALTSGLVLTIHTYYWSDTYLPDYPYPLIITGISATLIGISTLIPAWNERNWSVGIIGVTVLLFALGMFAFELIDQYLYISVFMGMLGLVGGGLALLVVFLQSRK